MLNKEVEKFLTESLGQPIRVSKKVSAWKLHSNAEVVLETNYEDTKKSSRANVWLPVDFAKELTAIDTIVYPEGKGRHSNTYASKGLERDKAAIKVRLSNTIEAEKLFAAVL